MQELTITLTDGSTETYRGGYRELNLLRARLLMAVEGHDVGILTHVLASGRVSIQPDLIRDVGPVHPA